MSKKAEQRTDRISRCDNISFLHGDCLVSL